MTKLKLTTTNMVEIPINREVYTVIYDVRDYDESTDTEYFSAGMTEKYATYEEAAAVARRYMDISTYEHIQIIDNSDCYQ